MCYSAKLDLTCRQYSVCMCVYVCVCVSMCVYVCPCVGMCVYVHVSTGANAGQHRALGHLEVELWVMVSRQKCVLGSELPSLTRVA